MDAKKLGKRIREARLAQKMTQADVVEGFITRNMLSQIESGVATPSMKTLEFLAGRLGLSVAVLMAEAENEPMEPLDKLLAAKDAAKAGDFDEVVRILEMPRQEDPFYDEHCALLTLAFESRVAAGDPSAADQARYFGSRGIYRRYPEAEK